MAVITWDAVGDHFYETGVKNGVLYPALGAVPAFSTTATYAVGDMVIYSNKKYKCKTAVSTAGEWSSSNWEEYKSDYAKGVAWNGLTGYTETPSGAEETALYADDIKYLSLRSAEEFGATIEAYTYPDEWEECDGSAELATGVMIGQQRRKSFGFCATTVIGNDVDGNDKGEKIHIIYNGSASPSERAYQTINDSPEAITFSWEVKTTPVTVGVKVAQDSSVEKYKATANLTIDTTKADATKVATLKGMLFGTVDSDPYLPTPKAIYDLFNAVG